MPCSVVPLSPVKPHGKNNFFDDFPMPKPDKHKLLGLAIHMEKFGKKWDEDEEEKEILLQTCFVCSSILLGPINSLYNMI